MDVREDGELSSSDGELPSSDGEVYIPISRPINLAGRNLPMDDSSEDDVANDSDSSSDNPPAKRACSSNAPRPKAPQQNGVKKRNNIWADVLQEDAVMEAFSDVVVKTVRKTDRNVESYEIPDAKCRKFSDSDSEHERINLIKRAKRFHTMKTNESKSKAANLMEEKTLENIDDNDLTDEQLGKVMADALNEQKADLIIKIVHILGKNLTLQLYRKTQLVETNGGVLVANGSRRRTSGGVFLYLLKSFENVTKDHLSAIFLDDKNEQVLRKRKRRAVERRKHQPNGISHKYVVEMEETNSKDFSEETGGIKCPGSTPVSSPQSSDTEEITRVSTSDLLVEVCEKAALELEGRI